MKYIFCFLVSIIVLQSCHKPIKSQSCNKRIKYIIGAVEGGGDTVLIDTVTPLKDLILRFEKPWEFVDTGKGYWIGYTKDMYSIANQNHKAINPLVNFIKSTPSLKAKIGGLYTLHLIGIQSHVAGRFLEKFKDTLARKALISFIKDKKLHRTVMGLLKRDPWPMDIPYLIDYLSKPDNNYIYVLSALQRYKIKDHPFGQKIPDSILFKTVRIVTNKPYTRQPIDMFYLHNTLKDKVIIDKEITNSREWKKELKMNKIGKTQTDEQSVASILESLSNSDFAYCEYDDNRFFYTYENNKITIYGANKAREIWINWWKNKRK